MLFAMEPSWLVICTMALRFAFPKIGDEFARNEHWGDGVHHEDGGHFGGIKIREVL